MKVLTGLTVVSVIAAFGIIAAPANAKSIFDQLNESAPRSVWDQLNETAPRSIFDQLNDSAPRSIFDQLNDSAPVRSPDRDLVGE